MTSIARERTALKPAIRLLIALAVLCGASSAEPGPAPGGELRASPERSADFEALLDMLAARADLYRSFALGFTCEESVVRSYYNAEQGTFRRRERELYDYLFERSEKSGRLAEVREILEENGKKVRRTTRDLSLDIPPSYAWSQIFARENRARFQFRPAGRILRGYRLLILIDFFGWSAEPGKEEIAGWSGRASVDSGTLNLHSIEAEPSGQSARIEAERLKYQRAFAIMGVPLASRPKSRALTVTFGFDNEGLTYPTETMLAKSVYVSTAEQGLEEKSVLRYRSYRFFRVGTAVDEAREKPLDPNAPPPPTSAPEAPAPAPPPTDPNAPRR